MALTAKEYRQLLTIKRLGKSGLAKSAAMRDRVLRELNGEDVRPGVRKLARKLLVSAKLTPSDRKTLGALAV